MKNNKFDLFSDGLILVVSLTFLFTNSCKHEGIQASELDPVCFTDKVLPVFRNSCGTTGCHDAKTAESGYVFTDYSSIMKAITPGNASKSKAYMAMTSPFTMMPPNNPLPQDKRVLIRLWIEQGAKETTCNSDGLVVKYETSWSCFNRFQPILMSSFAVPDCSNAASQKEGIDFCSYNNTLNQIKAGNPTFSKLNTAITANPGTEQFIPPTYSLASCEVKQIDLWIQHGYN